MERGTERKDFACISRCHCQTESRPTVCPFCCTNRRQILTFASGMQASSPLWASYIDAMASSWRVNFLARCNTRYKQSVVHDVIIPFAQHNCYWNWCKAMFLFQLISVLLTSITFCTYLANIVFSCDLDFKQPNQAQMSMQNFKLRMLSWIYSAHISPGTRVYANELIFNVLDFWPILCSGVIENASNKQSVTTFTD